MRKDRYVKRHFHKKSLTLVLALALSCVLLVCGVVGGTLAWLTDKTEAVTNTFSTSDIDITLAETTGDEYKMIPGWTIAKDPKATVVSGSEDCYLFVKVEKSSNFDQYMTYAIASGWTKLDTASSGNSEVYYMIFNSEDTSANKPTMGTGYSILGTGSYTDPMGTTSSNTECTCGGPITNEEHNANCEIIVDDVTVNWSDNQVCVKPSVTKEMMNALDAEGAVKPTLTFTAYAFQYWKQSDIRFEPAEAWAQASAN